MKLFKKNEIISSTYHFIRSNKDKKYKNINFFSINQFKEQLEFFSKKFNIIDEDVFQELLYKKKNQSAKPNLLLTFDDGYTDHYKYAFPLLNKKKIKGFFYPITRTINDKKFITFTNKIHFILSNSKNINELFLHVENFINDKTKLKFKVLLNKAKKIKYSKRRFDNKNLVIIKNFFNFVVPEKYKEILVDKIFKKIVSKDIEEFSHGIYLNKKQISEMSSNKMHFGTHTHSHIWLGKHTIKNQKKEILKSVNTLKKILGKEKKLSICYPFGSFNADTIQIAKNQGLIFGFSNKFGKVNLRGSFSKFKIPRFDCKDF